MSVEYERDNTHAEYEEDRLSELYQRVTELERKMASLMKFDPAVERVETIKAESAPVPQKTDNGSIWYDVSTSHFSVPAEDLTPLVDAMTRFLKAVARDKRP